MSGVKNNNEKAWKFYQPDFEYEKIIDLGGPWAGHKYFAYDLIRFLQPSKIVELGTHLGCSLFAFSQAVKDGKLKASIDAIDTWKGDQHAGQYGEIIFNRVKEIKKEKYSQLEINLIRTTFNKAKATHNNKSIDILHIDGLHSYNAIKHDFDGWIGKVKDDGVILVHDINVKEWGFGVYKFWNKVKQGYKTLEFDHSYGLGVIFKSENIFKEVEKFEQTFKVYYPLIAQREEYRWKYEQSETKIANLETKLAFLKVFPIYKIWLICKKIKNLRA